MRKWVIWLGGIVAVLGFIWALLPHTSHAAIVNALTGVPVSDVLASSHTAHKIEGWSAFVIGLVLVWIGIRK